MLSARLPLRAWVSLPAAALSIIGTTLAIGLAGAGNAASGQAIRGVVRDDGNLAPIPAGSVRLVLSGQMGRGTETDGDGWFFLAAPAPGVYQLEFQRIGYVTTRSQPVEVAENDTVTVEFRVASRALLMDPITVTARSRRGRVAFDRRRSKWHRGIFLDPGQVDSIAPRHAADVFRGLEKVDLRWVRGRFTSGWQGPVPSVRTYLGRGCMLYVIDGVQVVPAPWEDTDWTGSQLATLDGKDIVAVEVYRSVLEVPPELGRFSHRWRVVWSRGKQAYEDAYQCGVTVFWTRAGW